MKRTYVYRDPSIEHFNAPNIHDVHIDSALTNLSVAYRPTGFIAEQIFPGVTVQKQSDKYFKFEKGGWFRRDAAPRAPGTRAARVDYTIANESYNCTEKAAAKGVPDENVANADNPLKPMQEATDFVTDKLYLELEYDVASYVFGSSIWTGSANAATVWDDNSSDPVAEVTGADGVNETLRQLIGRRPNTMVLGPLVYAALKNHGDIIERIKYTVAFGNQKVTPQLLAQLFEVERVLVGDAIYNSGKEGATDSFADIWGKFVWIGYVAPNPGLMIPSAGYIFNWKNRQVNRYREDQEHQDVIEVLQSWDVKVTSADSGYLIKSVVA